MFKDIDEDSLVIFHKIIKAKIIFNDVPGVYSMGYNHASAHIIQTGDETESQFCMNTKD